MGFKIIYGRSGTGKSTYIFNEIKEKLKKNTTSPIKIITPEQFSFTAEQKLLANTNSNSVLKAEVITFNRMCYRALEEVGGKTKKNLSSSGRAMILDNILLTQKDEFTFLGKTDDVDMIATQLTELKKHNVMLNTLKKITQDMQDIYLKKKLEDVYNIYEAYTLKIQNQYIDENDGLTLLSEKIDNFKSFKNCDIYLDEFVGFTLQEYEILRKLMKNSNNITITICADDLKDDTSQVSDIFYANKQTANRLINIAKEENVLIEEPIKLAEEKRFYSKELKHLAENMRLPFYKKYEKSPALLYMGKTFSYGTIRHIYKKLVI